jgi:hypothetical protein
VLSREIKRHYKDITFRENRARLKLLKDFLDSVIIYFSNSTLNMLSGQYTEKQEAEEARAHINLIIERVYKIIRLADIKPSVMSTPSLAVGNSGKNIDLILNIFNLGRNNISSDSAIEFIERAMDVYKSNRLDSFLRTINPFFWIKFILRR